MEAGVDIVCLSGPPFTVFTEQGLPLTPELTDTAGQLDPGSPCLHLPVIRIPGGHHTHLTFYGEAGILTQVLTLVPQTPYPLSHLPTR